MPHLNPELLESKNRSGNFQLVLVFRSLQAWPRGRGRRWTSDRSSV